jgi:hypothetical protein
MTSPRTEFACPGQTLSGFQAQGIPGRYPGGLAGEHRGALETQRQVAVGEALINVAEYFASPSQFQAVLAAHHQPGRGNFAMCLCTTPAVKLVLRNRGRLILLEVCAGTGDNHAICCPFYRNPALDSPHARLARIQLAVREADGGHFFVSLTKRRADGMSARIGESMILTEHSGNTSSFRLRLTGLLEFLLSRAGADLSPPLRWAELSQRIRAEIQLGSIMWGDNYPLADVLHVIPAFDSRHSNWLNLAWRMHVRKADRRQSLTGTFLVCGEVKRLEQDAAGALILRLRHTRKKFLIEPALQNSFESSFHVAMLTRNGSLGATRALCLLIVRFRKGLANLEITEGAWLGTSPRYVPQHPTTTSRSHTAPTDHNAAS